MEQMMIPSHFVRVVTLKKMHPPIYRHFLDSEIKVSSCDVVVARFGHYVKMALKPGALPGVMQDWLFFNLQIISIHNHIEVWIKLITIFRWTREHLQIASFVQPKVQNPKTLHLLTKKSSKSPHLSSWSQQMPDMFAWKMTETLNW